MKDVNSVAPTYLITYPLRKPVKTCLLSKVLSGVSVPIENSKLYPELKTLWFKNLIKW